MYNKRIVNKRKVTFKLLFSILIANYTTFRKLIHIVYYIHLQARNRDIDSATFTINSYVLHL